MFGDRWTCLPLMAFPAALYATLPLAYAFDTKPSLTIPATTALG